LSITNFDGRGVRGGQTKNSLFPKDAKNQIGVEIADAWPADVWGGTASIRLVFSAMGRKKGTVREEGKGGGSQRLEAFERGKGLGNAEPCFKRDRRERKPLIIPQNRFQGGEKKRPQYRGPVSDKSPWREGNRERH